MTDPVYKKVTITIENSDGSGQPWKCTIPRGKVHLEVRDESRFDDIISDSPELLAVPMARWVLDLNVEMPRSKYFDGEHYMITTVGEGNG